MFLYHYRWCGKCWSESQGTHFFQKLEITLRKRLPWIICPTMTNISIKRSRLGKLCLATTHDQVESSFYLPKYSHLIKNEFAVFCHLTWYMWQSSLYIKIIIIVIIFVQDLVLRAFDIWHKLAISLLTSPFCRYWTFVTRIASMTMSFSLTGNVDTYM